MTTSDALVMAWAIIIAAICLTGTGAAGYWLRGRIDELRAYRNQQNWDRIRARFTERQVSFGEPKEVLYSPLNHGSSRKCDGCALPLTAGQAVMQFEAGGQSTFVCLTCTDFLPDALESTEVNDGKQAHYPADV